MLQGMDAYTSVVLLPLNYFKMSILKSGLVPKGNGDIFVLPPIIILFFQRFARIFKA
jgi:hypothetical protein